MNIVFDIIALSARLIDDIFGISCYRKKKKHTSK